MNEQLQRLIKWVEGLGYRVSSSYRTTGTTGLGHRQGRAVDVSMVGVSQAAGDRLIEAARARGLTVLDERIRPAGRAFRYWTAPHLHIEIPAAGGASTADLGPTGGSADVTVDRSRPNSKLTSFAILAAALVLLALAASRLS